MDMALTLVAVASFFAMVLAWIVVPTSATVAEREAAAQPIASPQAAH
jgi:hypothetical protein